MSNYFFSGIRPVKAFLQRINEYVELDVGNGLGGMGYATTAIGGAMRREH